MAFHVERTFYRWGEWNMDITTILMIYVCRWTAFAWAYRDGGKDASVLTADQEENKILELPPFWKYFSYINFYGNSIVGPFCEYRDFEDFIERKNNYEKVHSTLIPGLIYFIGSFFCIGVSIALDPYFSPTLLNTDTFKSLGLWQKFIFFNISMFILRMTYYTGWGLANANVTACGLNYNKKGQGFSSRFGKIVNVKPIEFELSCSIKDRFDYWNCSCQLWLKNYIYFRIISSPEEAKQKPGKAAYASNITFLVSAIWHGLYPGYYLGFFYGFLGQQVNKYLFKAKSKFSWIPSIGRTALGWIGATLGINYAATHFALLDFYDGIEFSKQLNYIPSIVLVVLFVFFNLTGWGQRSEKKDKEKAKDQ